MALNIDGTTGISGVDGSASAPALQGTDSNTGINFASDTVNINTGGVTRTTVGSDGVFTNQKSGIFGNTSDSFTALNITSSTSGISELRFADTTANAGFVKYDHGGNDLIFATNTSERMKIKNDGNTVIDSAGTSFSHLGQFTSAHDGSRFGMAINNTNTGGGSQIAIRFHRASTDVGSISTTGSATAYNTSSDYRLKENAVAISDGITRLKTLKPYRFNWKSDSSTTVDGFFAHEVTAVPEAITGIKDAVATEDEPQKGIKKDDPIYQSIDQSKLVPLLTAALQEAVAKIEVLETKVAALEAG